MAAGAVLLEDAGAFVLGLLRHLSCGMGIRLLCRRSIVLRRDLRKCGGREDHENGEKIF